MSRPIAVVIVAAGSGSRIGGDPLKQFVEVGGLPLVVHAVRPFEAHDRVNTITVVVPRGYEQEWEHALRSRFGLRKVTRVLGGGATRRDSARIGVSAAAGDDPTAILIAIHDGARPNPSRSLLDRVFAAADEHGAAVPAMPVSDTVVRSADGVWWGSTVERSGLSLVQTPQVFRGEWIGDAHRQQGDAAVTDDSQLVVAGGHAVRLVEGEVSNLKVTTQQDLDLFRSLAALRGV